MKKTIILLAAVVVCFSTGLNVLAQRRGTPVSLNVAFDDAVSQAAGIRSDGMGAYLNGDQSVEAVLTEYGWFNFLSGARTVSAVYSEPVEIVTPLPAEETRTGVNIKTVVTQLKIQEMAVGQTQCVGLAVNIAYADAAKTVKTIGYRAGHGTLTNTAFAYLTHPDADTWIIEATPQTNCGAADNSLDSVARIRDTKTKGKAVPDIEYGRYFMPFRLILTRQ